MRLLDEYDAMSLADLARTAGPAEHVKDLTRREQDRRVPAADLLRAEHIPDHRNTSG